MQPKGYMVIADPSAPVREFDTITCAHDQKIVRVKVDPGGFCRICMKALCGPCADKGTCTPFEKQLEEMEKQGRFRKELGVE